MTTHLLAQTRINVRNALDAYLSLPVDDPAAQAAWHRLVAAVGGIYPDRKARELVADAMTSWWFSPHETRRGKHGAQH